MDIYMRGYEFDVNVLDSDGHETSVPVKLRLTSDGQVNLKKRFKESTTSTLFSASDDIERLVAVLDEALKFPGNTNKFKRGSELIDAMASAGMLGIRERQKLMTTIAEFSGIFNTTEHTSFDDQLGQAVDSMLSGGVASSLADSGN